MPCRLLASFQKVPKEGKGEQTLVADKHSSSFCLPSHSLFTLALIIPTSQMTRSSPPSTSCSPVTSQRGHFLSCSSSRAATRCVYWMSSPN